MVWGDRFDRLDAAYAAVALAVVFYLLDVPELILGWIEGALQWILSLPGTILDAAINLALQHVPIIAIALAVGLLVLSDRYQEPGRVDDGISIVLQGAAIALISYIVVSSFLGNGTGF